MRESTDYSKETRNIKLIWEEAASPEPHFPYTCTTPSHFPQSLPLPVESLSNSSLVGPLDIQAVYRLSYSYFFREFTNERTDRTNTELLKYIPSMPTTARLRYITRGSFDIVQDKKVVRRGLIMEKRSCVCCTRTVWRPFAVHFLVLHNVKTFTCFLILHCQKLY